MAFSILNVSRGRPKIFHLCILISDPSTSTMLYLGELGIFTSITKLIQSSRHVCLWRWKKAKRGEVLYLNHSDSGLTLWRALFTWLCILWQNEVSDSEYKAHKNSTQSKIKPGVFRAFLQCCCSVLIAVASSGVHTYFYFRLTWTNYWMGPGTLWCRKTGECPRGDSRSWIEAPPLAGSNDLSPLPDHLEMKSAQG